MRKKSCCVSVCVPPRFCFVYKFIAKQIIKSRWINTIRPSSENRRNWKHYTTQVRITKNSPFLFFSLSLSSLSSHQRNKCGNDDFPPSILIFCNLQSSLFLCSTITMKANPRSSRDPHCHNQRLKSVSSSSNPDLQTKSPTIASSCDCHKDEQHRAQSVMSWVGSFTLRNEVFDVI